MFDRDYIFEMTIAKKSPDKFKSGENEGGLPFPRRINLSVMGLDSAAVVGNSRLNLKNFWPLDFNAASGPIMEPKRAHMGMNILWIWRGYKCYIAPQKRSHTRCVARDCSSSKHNWCRGICRQFLWQSVLMFRSGPSRKILRQTTERRRRKIKQDLSMINLNDMYSNYNLTCNLTSLDDSAFTWQMCHSTTEYVTPDARTNLQHTHYISSTPR